MNELGMNEQMAKATVDWRVFDDITYKKIETRTITDYSSSFRGTASPAVAPIRPFVAMAPCGGPIACVYKKPSSAANTAAAYTIVIQNIPDTTPKTRAFDRGTIVLVDWTVKEDLIVVTEDGKYHIIDIFHYDTSNDKSLTLSEYVSAISSACTFKTNQGTGLVALRKNQEGFVAVKDVYIPSIQTIALDVRSTITAWCVLDHTDTTVIYAYDNIVFTCSAGSSRRDQQTVLGMTDTIVKLVSSSNYKLVAMLRDNGDVFMSLRDNIAQSQSFVLKYSSRNEKNKITDIAWCGSDAVIGIRSSSKTWFDLLVINAQHSIPMTYVLTPESVWNLIDRFIPSLETRVNKRLPTTAMRQLKEVVFTNINPTEIDGVRIISGRNLDFFQRLPNEIFNAFSLMSDSPGAKLYSAYMNYKYENQMGELLLNQLKSTQSSSGLEEAVRQCILAASNEHDPATQKILLKAALFGRSFLSVNLTNPTSSIRPAVTQINNLCTDVIRNLHLVNNLQHISISIPITYKQFELLGTRVLIDRLLRRNLHEFATRVTKLLRMPAEEGENRILVKWAVQQLVNPSNSNEEGIADTIKLRLADVPGIPFIDIVREAYTLKKYTVVKRLLDVKVSVRDQVDMLLMLSEKEEALQKAIACGDTDLVLHVLMHIRSQESLVDYVHRLQKLKSIPLKLQLQCLEEAERNSVYTEIMRRNPEERERVAYSHITARFTTALTTSDQKSELTSASKIFREAKNDAVLQLVDEETRLITRQDDLEKKLLNVQLRGLSLVNTLETLLLHSEKDADTLKKEFGLPDKRYWWIKIQAYAKKNAWAQLAEFGRKPSSPIGYEPFVDVCIQGRKFDEARRFTDRSIYSSKLDDERFPFMLAKVQLVDEAITAALKQKSLEALHFIESKCELTEATSGRLRQAKEKLQEYDQNPLRNVFRLFNRGNRDGE